MTTTNKRGRARVRGLKHDIFKGMDKNTVKLLKRLWKDDGKSPFPIMTIEEKNRRIEEFFKGLTQ